MPSLANSIAGRLLQTAQSAHAAYKQHGARSNEKTKVLHGWVQRELRQLLGPEYKVQAQSGISKSEGTVDGKYYRKNVDILVIREGINLAVISIKFVISNFRQNANNYFEGQLGETANLRQQNIVFAHLMCLTEPIPYRERSGRKREKDEHIRDLDIERYLKLSQDHEHPHSPDAQAICVFHLDFTNDKDKGDIDRICKREDLMQLSDENFETLRTDLSVDRFFRVLKTSIEAKYEERKSGSEKF